MLHILFIGYGNPLRCDDGFGWHLASRLQKQFADADVEILACHQLTPELAQAVSRATYVIFADASVDPTASEISLCKIHADLKAPQDFSHHLAPQALLALTRQLYDGCPVSAFLLTVHACDLGYGEGLSPRLNRVLEKAVRRVTALCEFLKPELRAEHSLVMPAL